MNDKQKQIDPMLDEFASYEAAAEFWDTHDTTDYLDSFEMISLEVELKQQHFEVEIDTDLIKMLHEQARKRDISVNQFVNDIIRETLRHVA